MTFLWTKVSNVVMKRANGVTKLIQSSSTKAISSDLTATLTRPTAPEMFYEMLHLFVMVIVSFGLASYTTVAKFTDDVA